MPTSFSVDHDHRAVFTTANGILSLSHVRCHIQEKVEADVLSYSELFDARDVSLDLSISELSTIAKEVREVMGSVRPGKVAVVTNNNFIYGLARTYQALTATDNPRFEVFRDFDVARSWLLQEQEQEQGEVAGQ